MALNATALLLFPAALEKLWIGREDAAGEQNQSATNTFSCWLSRDYSDLIDRVVQISRKDSTSGRPVAHVRRNR